MAVRILRDCHICLQEPVIFHHQFWERTMSVKVRVSKTRSPHQINPFDELENQIDETL